MTTQHKTIGIIAGNGALPFVFAAGARAAGWQVIAVGIQEEADPALARYVDAMHWIAVGELSALLGIFKQHAVNTAAMVGQIRHRLLFADLARDPALAALLAGLPDHRTDTILGAVAALLQRQGIAVVDSSLFLKDMLPESGCLTAAAPSPQQYEDIAFGFSLAKAVAGLDIGQTVVVKNKSVLSVEAIEGTDEAIRRAALYCHEGAVVVKVSKPKQDMRFDVPIVGPATIQTLLDTRAAVLAIEAGKTILLDRAGCIARADSRQICVVAVDAPGIV